MALFTRLTNGGSTSGTPSSPRVLQRFQNCIAFLWPSLQTVSSNRTTTAAVDAIDSFTNDLVSRNSKKWEVMRAQLMKNVEAGAPTTSFNQIVDILKAKDISDEHGTATSPKLRLDIRSLSRPQLDNLLLSTLEIRNKIDFLYLIKQCILWRQLPSDGALIACLKYLCSLSKLQDIESFIEICEQKKSPLLDRYAGFMPFRAMAEWRCGNSNCALSTLSRAYDLCNPDLHDGRRITRAAFRTITEETLASKSEAVLVSLIEKARTIYTKHKDIFVLACIWKQCFLSEWFSDQKSAAQLLEEFKDLQDLIGKRSNFLSTSFLRQGNIDAIYRLIEAFLQYKQMEACANSLAVLFEYQYQRGDLRACAEIIKSCKELDLPLCEHQNEQFLNLFLNQIEPNLLQNCGKKSQKPSKSFQYKF